MLTYCSYFFHLIYHTTPDVKTSEVQDNLCSCYIIGKSLFWCSMLTFIAIFLVTFEIFLKRSREIWSHSTNFVLLLMWEMLWPFKEFKQWMFCFPENGNASLLDWMPSILIDWLLMTTCLNKGCILSSHPFANSDVSLWSVSSIEPSFCQPFY